MRLRSWLPWVRSRKNKGELQDFTVVTHVRAHSIAEAREMMASEGECTLHSVSYGPPRRAIRHV